MARETNITFGKVAQIAETMTAAGQRPTARAVRERIGSGSMGTIHKLLTQWKGKESNEEAEEVALPDSISKALMDFIGTEIATACEPINDALQEVKEEAAALANENEHLESVIDRLRIERNEAQQERSAALALNNQARFDLDTASIDIKELQERIENLVRELELSRKQTELFASYAPELEKVKAALIESERARVEAQQSAAVNSAKLEAATASATDLRQRLDKAESLANAASAEAKTNNQHYQACAARLEAAAREIESLKKPRPTATRKQQKPQQTQNS